MHFCEEVYCDVRKSDMVFACGSAGGDADRSQPLGLRFLLVIDTDEKGQELVFHRQVTWN